MNITSLLDEHSAPIDDNDTKMESIPNLSDAKIDDAFSLGSLESVNHINSPVDPNLSSLPPFPHFLSHIPSSLLGPSLTSTQFTSNLIHALPKEKIPLNMHFVTSQRQRPSPLPPLLHLTPPLLTPINFFSCHSCQRRHVSQVYRLTLYQ